MIHFHIKVSSLYNVCKINRIFLWALAEEDPEKRSLVVLRPAAFMTNHLMGDIRHIKRSNKILSCSPPSSKITWIDTKGR